MADPQRLCPVPPAQAPDEPRAHYGARLFCAVLDDSGALLRMTDDQIDLAAYGARIATDAREMSPQYYDRTADAVRLIAGAARRRAANRDQGAALDTTIQAPPLGRPNGPAVPVHPYPTASPPAGGHADHPSRPLTRAGDHIRF